MRVEGIDAVELSPLSRAARQRAPDFGKLFTDLVSKLSALESDADRLAQGLAAGEPVDIHEVMLALEKANLGFQLALQVRNKVIEAYQEVMRLQL
jgi:flagellar hook-basal body complex protein FliE